MSNSAATQTFDKVKSIIVDKLGVEDGQVTLETSFEALGADSLDLVELVMALEETFGVEISDEDAEGIKTVANAVSYIERVAAK